MKKKIKLEEYTKRLQKLVKIKKTPVVVYKEGTFKQANSEGADNYTF